jgi:hypothetical protein
MTDKIEYDDYQTSTMVIMYLEEGLGTPYIGKVFGVSPTTIVKTLRSCGVEIRNRVECHKVGYQKGRIEKLNGDKAKGWKGGRVTNSDGYIKILAGADHPFVCMAKGRPLYILEHRLVMARHLGRPLKESEIVHHLNGIRKDNRFENLGMVNRKRHDNNTVVKLIQERVLKLESELKKYQKGG